MHENDKPVLIYSTFPDADCAQKVGADLVSRGLSACVNILPGMTSIYRWRGEVTTALEVVMLIKTRSGLVDGAVSAVREQHPYETAAILVVPVAGGSEPYLAWIVANTQIRS